VAIWLALSCGLSVSASLGASSSGLSRPCWTSAWSASPGRRLCNASRTPSSHSRSDRLLAKPAFGKRPHRSRVARAAQGSTLVLARHTSHRRHEQTQDVGRDRYDLAINARCCRYPQRLLANEKRIEPALFWSHLSCERSQFRVVRVTHRFGTGRLAMATRRRGADNPVRGSKSAQSAKKSRTAFD
jgi:hypothetical protein